MIRDLLSKKYSKANFEQVVSGFLHGYTRSFTRPQALQGFPCVEQLGVANDLDLVVFAIDTGKGVQARMDITKRAYAILKQHPQSHALLAFYSNDSSEWRVSLITTKVVRTTKGIIEERSNPRRFSYVVGPVAKLLTVSRQLTGTVSNLTELEERFSVEVVNKQFYFEVAKYFDELVSNEDRNFVLPSVSQSNINTRKNFAVRLIGRIMFCWFLKQKKSAGGQLMPDEILSSATVGDGYYHSTLEPLFFGVLNTSIDSRDIRSDLFDKVPYLNGGLFNPQTDDYYDLDRGTFTSKHINTLKINDEWFKHFFELLETYNFTIDENTVLDQELSVDPEMLGRIFENLLAEINPETGSSERKRTGSFYTPRQIVEYMVDQSLIEYLKTKTKIGEKKIAALVSYDLADDLEYPLNEDEKREVSGAIENIKILDPACGSGAYPIGALQKIVYILQQIDPDCKLWLDQKLKGVPELYKQKIINEVKSNPFDYTRKLDVIKNSIFGVDIQPIAVDVSRLRCFLTLVVESAIDDSKPNRGIEPLPNLDFKFVCANTLVGLPKPESKQMSAFEDHSGIMELSKIMSEYFSCNSQRKNEIKLKFINVQKEILEKTISAFGRNTGELTLKLITWNPFGNTSNLWFDSEWMFGLGDKFDIVIANPPYVDSEIMVREQPELRDLYSKTYSTAKGNWDLYIPFLELAHNLLAEKGTASFITPNKWYAIGYGKEIRKKLLSEIVRIANCNLVKVFEAGNSPVVTIFKKHANNERIVVDKFDSSYNIVDSVVLDNKMIADNFGVVFADNLPLISKIKFKNNKLVSDYFRAENPCSVSEAYEIQKLISELSARILNADEDFLFVNTGTIDPYLSLWGKKLTTYLKSKYKMPVVNKIKFKELFPRRFDQFVQQKLIISGMRHFESFLDYDGKYIAGKSTEILIKNGNLDLKVALAIFNSKLISFYIKQNYSVLGIDGGINFTTDLINNLPFPNFDSNNNEEKLIALVDNILDLKNESHLTKIQNEIDELVMNLYGLDDEEKEIIRKS